ncbi:hypothetical protein GCM10010345_04380 [Streptomyces canarius]|uniref:Uncharacterized protein n=1 Tax=Streptomyces canarius TaxID=285453 RepID=A0ABQ3CIQ7_9ACTN|nr:hypothetical protein GCM10010345_04380 [Streptomyces canarius]
MSPAWDMESPPASGVCARCGRWTEAGIQHWIPRASGPEVDVILCADPADSPRRRRPTALVGTPPAGEPDAPPHRAPDAQSSGVSRVRVRSVLASPGRADMSARLSAA